MARFVIIDETIVSRGFWVKVSGIDLTQFRKNPIMLWMHQRPNSYDGQNQVLPIGYWKDIRLETINGIKSITAEAVFDEKDKFAIQIKDKVDAGIIKMASAGLKTVTWSEDEKHIKAGQKRATLLKSELQEASIVDIGANKNALRLYNDNGLINLSDYSNNIPTIKLKQSNNMKAIAIFLALGAMATEDEILAELKIRESQAKSDKEKLSELQTARIKKLMQHESITDDNKEHFEALAKQNYGLAEKTLEIIATKEKKEQPKQERLSDAIINKKPSGTSNKAKAWSDYSDKELEELRETSRDVYLELFNDEFGYFPDID